eukprot:8224746-Pyramimonas_sp.AAC.1
MARQGGPHKSIAYGRILDEKDKRRIELAVAVFFKTYVERGDHVHGAFGNHGEPPKDDLLWP